MKMPVRVYNKFLDLQIETDAYQSLQYRRSYHGVGEFELHINRYMHGAEYFLKGNIIALNKQKNKAGLILTREIDLDDSGMESENFKLTGITLDGIMNRRVSVPPADTAYDRKSGDAETVMKHYVYNHFVNPTDSSRKLDMLEIAPNQNRGEHVSWESRFKNIGEELEKISIESGLGWGIYVDFNTKKLVFDCFQAKNLVQNNEFGYSPVFFSPEFETIKSQSFIDSDQDYKNVGYVGGQGEGKERKIVELGDSTGWDRIETFVDARDVGTEDEESEEELTDEEIEKQLFDRGKSKMKEMETVFSLEAEILTPITRKAYEYTHEGYLHPAQPKGRYEAKQQQVTPFQYEKDFDLGDRVQVVNKSWGLTMTAPITEFMEIHEQGGFRLEGTFGESRPNLITKIQDKFNELEGIEKQEAPASVAVEKMKEALKYTDDKLTEEERKRIEQAMENLEKSMEHTKDYTYNKDAIDEKDKQVEDSAKQDATDKAKEAREAAEAVAEAKAELAETQAKAHADDKITKEQEARIEQAKADLAEAKAAAELAETEAKAYSDGKVTAEEKRAIQDAKDKLVEAKRDAEQKSKAAEDAAKNHAENEDKKVRDDAQDYANEAERKANDFSKNADNLMEGIINVGSVPIQTAYNGSRIEFDGTNGFVQYDKNDNPVAWFDLDGNARFAGDITGASGTFGDVNVKDGDFTLEDDQSNVAYSITPKRNLIKDHSFESLKIGDVDLDGNEHNYTNFDVPDLPQEQMWTKSRTPKLVIQRWIAYADALPIHGDKAVLVKDANFIRQAVDDGIGGNQEYTLSAFFKQQWNLEGGIPRFEVDHMSKTGERKKRLFNKTFDRVTGYTARRLAYSFVVPSDFGVDDYLDVKISGGDDNWVQVDGVQLVEGSKPAIYQPEDSVWEAVKGSYPIINKHTQLWSGGVYLLPVHEVKPDKKISECRNGWILEWSRYEIGDGPVDSNWKWTYVPKFQAYRGSGAHVELPLHNRNEYSSKYYYIDDDQVRGHDSNGKGENRSACLRGVYEW